MNYEELEKLKAHYGVQTLQDLMDCLTKHIETLQAKLNRMEKQKEEKKD